MPDLAERREFLHRVADAVDLQPAEVGEVIDELWAHLDDSAEGWRRAALDPADAERRAIRGMGDPETLGRELGRARHRRRYLLAAVGGAVFNTFAFGIWAYLTLWIIGGGLALVGGILAAWSLTALGGSASGWFTGPVGSLGTVALTTLWFAWAGWILPGRVARSAHRSVRGVQRAVGIAGFVIGTWALWAWMPLDMDPVLAVGLPLAPVAFVIAAQRPNHGRSLFPQSTLRQRAAIALAVVLATALVGLLTVDSTGNHQMSGGWDPGLASLGSDPMADPALASAAVVWSPSISIDGTFRPGGVGAGAAVVGGVSFPGPADAAAFEHRVIGLELQILPASVAPPTAAGPGAITLRGGPMAAASVQLPVPDLESAVRLEVPVPRTRTQLVAVLIGQGSDGAPLVLGFSTMQSPAWHGTLFDWWFTAR